ncbi:MAG: hypothetical protein Q9174_002811 [Haloplaca sp. 1 TL-2023]
MSATKSIEDVPEPTSQYHHYVPRFLLRNYAVHRDGYGISTTTTKTKKKKGKAKSSQPQNLNLLNLQTGVIEQTFLSKNFGVQDMYRDFKSMDPDQQHKLERQLGRLEEEVSQTISLVKRRFEAGKEEVHLSRREKDQLRKFLFIMHYRNRTFQSRFEKSREDYDANDRETMLQYMDEKGFTHPREVWFANLRVFLTTENPCDPHPDRAQQSVLAWRDELMSQAYPPDAQWFWKNTQMHYTCFCTPSCELDEFLMTQNAYSVFEGPNDIVWTDYHLFAPITPKLMIVTRQNVLRNSSEAPGGFDNIVNLMRSQHLYPEKATSLLQDLPVAVPGNNYSTLVNGKRVLSATKMSPAKHVFFFKFFRIATKHVQLINTVFLEEAYQTECLAFKTKPGLVRAIEAYLRDKTGFKKPRIEDFFEGCSYRRPQYLQLLQDVAEKTEKEISAE